MHLEQRLQQVMRTLIGALRGEPIQAPRLPHFGIDARAEVREYELLFDLLLDVAAESNHALTPDEVRVFTRFTMTLTRELIAVHATRRTAAEAEHARNAVQIERRVRREEPRWRSLFEMVVAGNWALDLSTQLVIADASLLALHHLDSGNPVPLQDLRRAIHPDDRSEIEAAVQAALNPQGTGQYQLYYRVEAGPGRWRWVQTTGQTLFEHGVPRQIVGTALEVTQRKEAELARDGLLEALEAQPLVQLMVLEGPEHVIKLINGEYRRGVAADREIVGLPLFTAFPQFAAWDDAMKDVLQSGKPMVARNLLAPIQVNGVMEDHYYDFVVQPLRGISGAIDGMMTLSLDVTASVEARRSLEAFVEQEKARAELERQIIGVVNHELSNPLAVLETRLQQLLGPAHRLEPGAEKIVGAMQSTLEGMSRLVNDLLDFAQARQGGGLSIARVPMNMHEVVREALDELRTRFPQRELVLEHEGDGTGSWDRLRVSQAATNLVINALKHGLSKAPVRVSTHGFEDRVELRVFNLGEPIPADLVPRVFEPMQRGRAQPAELGRSVGLGLYIVKHIVDALGGSVTVTSTAETGTKFVLSFPR